MTHPETKLKSEQESEAAAVAGAVVQTGAAQVLDSAPDQNSEADSGPNSGLGAEQESGSESGQNLAAGPESSDEAVPLALVRGEPFNQLPTDLYIPPDALEVILETFEGPLDLLLYLIKRQNLDILNIPIAHITEQYMEYIGLMDTMRLELAAEYLLMAAMLAEIKSRMLLPRVETDAEDEDDPRAELIRRLQEYERIKEASENLAELPRLERDLYVLSVEPPVIQRDVPLPDITLRELLMAFKDVAGRNHAMRSHNVTREALTVRERMTQVLTTLRLGDFCEFSTLFLAEEGRHGVVVTFLAILELCKEASIDIVQSAPYAPIYLKVRSSVHEVEDLDEVSIADSDGSVLDASGSYSVEDGNDSNDVYSDAFEAPVAKASDIDPDTDLQASHIDSLIEAGVESDGGEAAFDDET